MHRARAGQLFGLFSIPNPVFGVGWVSRRAFCLGYVAKLTSPHHGDPKKVGVM